MKRNVGLAIVLMAHSCAVGVSHGSDQGYIASIKRTLSRPDFKYMYGACLLLNSIQYLYSIGVTSKMLGVPADSEVAAFVHETLLKAGYPADTVNAIQVKFVQDGGFASFGNIIFVPISKNELDWARFFYRSHDAIPDNHPHFVHHVLEHKAKLNVSHWVAREYAQFSGNATTRHTLSLWKGVLIHEMSHCMHNDSYKRMGVSLGVTPIAFAFLMSKAFEEQWLRYKYVRNNQETFMGFYSLLSYLISLPISKWGEYRSDQEIIWRIKDPEILDAVTRGFEALAVVTERTTPLNGILYELCDEHPHARIRANYFGEALKKLTAQKHSIKI